MVDTPDQYRGADKTQINDHWEELVRQFSTLEIDVAETIKDRIDIRWTGGFVAQVKMPAKPLPVFEVPADVHDKPYTVIILSIESDQPIQRIIEVGVSQETWRPSHYQWAGMRRMR